MKLEYRIKKSKGSIESAYVIECKTWVGALFSVVWAAVYHKANKIILHL